MIIKIPEIGKRKTEKNKMTLKQAMKKSGHKAHEAAIEMRVSVSTVYNAKKGTMPANPHLREAIERYIKRWSK